MALVSEEKRMNFDRDIQQITHLITREYHRGVDGSWLKGLIEDAAIHTSTRGGSSRARQNIYCRARFRNTWTRHLLPVEVRETLHRDNLKRSALLSVSAMRSCTRGDSTFALTPLPLTDIHDFKFWMQEEYKYVKCTL
ncbi:MAG: hypothetical protein ACLR8Y_03675 [Alistipes indistinctus]